MNDMEEWDFVIFQFDTGLWMGLVYCYGPQTLLFMFPGLAGDCQQNQHASRRINTDEPQFEAVGQDTGSFVGTSTIMGRGEYSEKLAFLLHLKIGKKIIIIKKIKINK